MPGNAKNAEARQGCRGAWQVKRFASAYACTGRMTTRHWLPGSMAP